MSHLTCCPVVISHFLELSTFHPLYCLPKRRVWEQERADHHYTYNIKYLETETKNKVPIATLIPQNSKAVGSLAEETIIHSLGQLFWEGFSVFCQSSVCVVSVHASVLCYHGSPNPRFSAGPPILPQGSRVAESTPPNNGPCTRTQTDCF